MIPESGNKNDFKNCVLAEATALPRTGDWYGGVWLNLFLQPIEARFQVIRENDLVELLGYNAATGKHIETSKMPLSIFMNAVHTGSIYLVKKYDL